MHMKSNLVDCAKHSNSILIHIVERSIMVRNTYAREILSFLYEECRNSLSYQCISSVISAESSTAI